MTRDAALALRRLEDIFADVRSDCRQLRRTISAQRRRVRHLLPGAPRDDRAAHTRRFAALAAGHRNSAAVLRQKARVGELWESIVVRAWYERVVVAEFYAHVVRRLGEFDRRLQRAAAAVRPERRLCGAPPAVMSVVDISAAGTRDGRFLSAPLAASSLRRTRQLRTAVALATRVPREYLRERACAPDDDSHRSAESCRDDCGARDCCAHCGDHDGDSSLFTVEQLAEVVQHILSDPAVHGQQVSAEFIATAQTPAFTQALYEFISQQRYLDTWGMSRSVCSSSHCALAWCKYYTQTVETFTQQKSRATSDLLVTRRQQHERNEARWQSLRASAATTLQPLLNNLATGHDNSLKNDLAASPCRSSSSSSLTGHDTDCPDDISECTLWLVVRALRQQRAEEKIATRSASS